MKKSLLLRLMMGAAIPGMALSACSDKDNDVTPDNPDQPNTEKVGRYVFATNVENSNGSGSVLVTGESLDEGVLTTNNNGLTNAGATQWVFHQDYLYALQYNQGNDGTTRSYILGANGQMSERSKVYSISRFSSYGAYDDDILTMSTGTASNTEKDANGNSPMTLLVTYLNVKDQTATDNDTSNPAYCMENYVGNGEYCTLSGAEQVGSRLFSGVVPMGLSPYGSAVDGGKWIRKTEDGFDFRDLIPTENGGTGGGSYTAGQLTGTQYPDECWVAIYPNDDFTTKKLVKTDKISSPCGRFRSQYYQTVWADDNGDVYVFSSSYAKTMSDPHQQTKLDAGVCRIPKGSDEFDNYYCSIEALSKNHASFMRCWPAGGSYFLMVMYDRPFSESGYAATELAIFDAAGKTLKYVEGLPANVTSIGKTVYVENGKVYIPINVDNEYPAIYGINPATAQAQKGVTIEATEITGFGFLTSQD